MAETDKNQKPTSDKTVDERAAKVDIAKVKMALDESEVEETVEEGFLQKAPKLAVVDEDQLEKFPILAWLVGYSMSKVYVPFEIFEGYLKDIGLDEKYKPAATKEKDAFMVATKMRERRLEISYSGLRITGNYYVRDVVKSGPVLVRHLVREISLADVDKDKAELQHRSLLAWSYDKETHQIAMKVLEPDDIDKETADREHKAMLDEYELQTTCFTAKNIRDALRSKWLRASHAIPFGMASRGVWVISDEYRADLKKFETLFATIYDQHSSGAQSNRFRVIPLADGEKNKKMVAEDVQDQLNRQLAKVYKKVLKQLKDSESMTDGMDAVKAVERAMKSGDSGMEDAKLLKEHFEKMLGMKLAIDLTRGLELAGEKDGAIEKPTEVDGSARAEQLLLAFQDL